MPSKIFIDTIKAIKKIYTKLFVNINISKPISIDDPNKVSQIIYERLMSDKPCMVARFGSTELNMVVNYLGIIKKEKSFLKFIQGNSLPWWWEQKRMLQMQDWSGFFPPTEEKITRFCELTLADLKEVDVLGSWLENEHFFLDKMKCELVQREIQNPFFAKLPWTKALEGKKVLVVHPFAELIEHQYTNCRKKLFKNLDMLPKFELQTIKAIQTLGGKHEVFKDWFEALEWMKNEIDKCDYDICLIGAGAYGFPLAAHVKRKGKKAVHLGGSLQLLFGIKGNRWENPNYNKDYNYVALMNQHWVKPGESFRPENAESVEGACYW